MNIKLANRLAVSTMEKHGLIEKGWTFKFDRAKVRFGQCSHTIKRITLSEALTELNSLEQVTDTILHEVAHALVGSRNGHNYKWRMECVRIGANPDRCYGNEVIQPENARLKRKWQGTCPNGHKTRLRARRTKISCGRCSRVYNPEYLFIWSEVNSVKELLGSKA